MSEFDDLIRHALREDADAAPPDETHTGRVLAHFLRRTRWVAAFAWMKMIGTMLISVISAGCFFAAETTQAQIAWATLFTAGFVGFAMWWIWYWMILNRNDALRELKRLELQIAELRGREHA